MAIERITIEVKDLLPPKKAAKYLGSNTMRIWRWVRAGKLTPVMLDHTYFHINELNRVKKEMEEIDKLKNDKRANVVRNR